MSIDQIAVLVVFILMLLGFMLNKWSFGLVSLTCCVLLSLVGVLDVESAFAGFAMKNVILIAGMYVIVAAFSKTSLVTTIRKRVLQMQGNKNSFAIIVVLMVLTVFFAQFLPASATITVMIMFLSAFSDDGEITPSRMLLPIASLGMMASCALPIGMGLTVATYDNVFIDAYGEELPRMQVLDYFKVIMIPLICCIICTVLTYKMLPKRSVDNTKLKKVKEVAPISKRDEWIIYVVFCGIMACMFLNSILGDLMYIAPVVGSLILVYTKAMDIDEARGAATSSQTFMLAGILVMSNALASTGVGEMIGNFILGLMGENPSSFKILLIFALATGLMTNVMSNSGCANIMLPLGVATAVAAGWNPVSLLLIVECCCHAACLLPSGAPSTAIAFAAGGYKLKETLPWSLLYFVVVILSSTLSVLLFCPPM